MVAGLQLQNCLPVKLRQRDMRLNEFRQLLNTFLFCDIFLFNCAIYNYNYLLNYLLMYIRRQPSTT